MDLDKLRSVVFAEAQRKAEEILSSAEEEIAKLRQEHEKRVEELKLATAERKKKLIETETERWKRQIEYEKRMLLEQVIVQAIQGLKGRIEDQIVSGGYAPSYVDWLKKQVPEADEWTVSREYDELQRAFSKKGIRFIVDDSKKVKARKGDTVFDLSPDVVANTILERFSHEIYEEFKGLLK